MPAVVQDKTSRAQSSHTLKCRTGQHAIKFESYPVPSAPPGHVVGAGQTSGLAFFGDGEVAILDMAFTIDWPDGKSGTHANYSKFSFEDGSHILILELGLTNDNPDGATSAVAATSISILEGSGRFAGIQGNGTMTGKRFAALGSPNANTYLDYSLNFTVPAQ